MNDRYSRQTVLTQMGLAGQEKLLACRVTVIGCGALGTHIASTLVRAGIGVVRLVDRDVVELNNLQRQTLFDETDIGVAKVDAACKKLRLINSEITINGWLKDVHNGNIEEIIAGSDLVMDATDNIPTRMLVNDACIKHGIPWVYGGVIRTEGMVMSVLPAGPCLRCLLHDVPPADAMTSCELVGVLNSIVAIVAAVQCTEAFKILLDKLPEPRKLIIYDVWEHHFNAVTVPKNPHCTCCGQRDFTFLNNKNRDLVVGLCANSVQIIPPKETSLDLQKLAANMGQTVQIIVANTDLLRFMAEGKQITLYRDGRALIKGTGDNGVARSVYSRYVGL